MLVKCTNRTDLCNRLYSRPGDVKPSANFTHQCDNQMVENKICGHNSSHIFPSLVHSIVHNFNPTFLGKDLKHGHECLKGERIMKISVVLAISCRTVSRYIFQLSVTKYIKQYNTISVSTRCLMYICQESKVKIRLRKINDLKRVLNWINKTLNKYLFSKEQDKYWRIRKKMKTCDTTQKYITNLFSTTYTEVNSCKEISSV